MYNYLNRDPSNVSFLAGNNLASPRSLFLELGCFDTDLPRTGAEGECGRRFG